MKGITNILAIIMVLVGLCTSCRSYVGFDDICQIKNPSKGEFYYTFKTEYDSITKAVHRIRLDTNLRYDLDVDTFLKAIKRTKPIKAKFVSNKVVKVYASDGKVYRFLFSKGNETFKLSIDGTSHCFKVSKRRARILTALFMKANKQCTECHCQTLNPLEELDWLKKKLNKLYEKGCSADEIYSCKYQKDKDGFLFVNTTCRDVPQELYDCRGNRLCTIGGVLGRRDTIYNIEENSLQLIFKL